MNEAIRLDVTEERLGSIPIHWKLYAISQLLWDWDCFAIKGEELFDQLVQSLSCEHVESLVKTYSVLLAFNLEQVQRDDFVHCLFRMALEANETAVNPTSVRHSP